ncbi:hypothetical protein CEE36_07765 [candidate division TA06 bacterium B3_TA06]|uniref:Leucine Rich repeats (2 copies) n=1 Tax=candidate division TA06 bacterium B3_TA06 TaxID=2012487 RepID=A0A532V418_UNCT6|nr:MAG: hypothetical protein CEE36_07765 [candidate division TA06 bacterium B3_TA06]
MKSVLKLVLIKSALTLVAALGVLACKKEVAASAVQDAPEPRTLVLIRRDPHMDEYYVQTVDVTWWEEGRDAIIIHGAHTIIPYPWQGEDTIIYAYDGDYLWVRTKPQDTTFFFVFGYRPNDYERYDVWEKGKAKDTLSIEFYEPPYNYWAQGRVIGLSTHRYYRMEIENPEDIVCVGEGFYMVPDSLEQYPNLVAVGFSNDYGCIFDFSSYVYLINYRRNLRKIPENLDLYVDYSHPTPGLCNCKSRVLSRRKNLAGLVCYIPPWANNVLRHIGRMRNLRQLDIRYYSANDRKLRHLARLKNLHTLTLDRIKITDRGLSHLGKIPSLRSLTLDNYQRHGFDDFLYWCDVFGSYNEFDLWTELHIFFDDIIEFLEIFPYAYGSMFIKPTTAEGWQNFAELSVLEELKLYGVIITDEDLRGIGQITSLRRLDQIGGNITDVGIKYLENLTKLCDLNLTSTEITDASLPLLMKLTSLKKLNISYTLMTADGAARLQEALPDCDVVWAGRR